MVLEPRVLGFCPKRLERVTTLLQSGVDQGVFPGAVALVCRRAGIAYYRAVGLAARQPQPRPARTDTIYDLASLTKVVATTPAILTLVERGALRLDDPVSVYLPEFEGDGREGVTVRHLLAHSSGLPAWIDLTRAAASPDQRLAAVLAQPLENPPGTKVVYSDLGFILLGLLVSRLSGDPLDRFCQENIFRPLGMTETGYLPGPELKLRIAATEYRPERGIYQWAEVHDENTLALGGVAGQAGLFAPAADLARYARCLLNGGQLDGFRLLAPATLAAMRRNQTPGLNWPRGLGWDLISPTFSSGGDLLSPEAYGHTGFTGTSLWIDPQLDLGIILLTNRVHLGRENTGIISFRPRLANAVAAALER
ncbi:MAG: serine hydrolase domain-containing protein [Bacillota bacterium]